MENFRKKFICYNKSHYKHDDLPRKKKIFPINKLHLLRDPIFRIDDFLKLRENKTNKIFGNNKKIILSVGRLTKQKNFGFLIENFSKISDSFPDYVLLIIGSGEQKIELEKKIKNLKMQEKIKIMNYQKNIYRYYLNANLFVLVSLWEDPGFVIFEAAINNLTVLSSDCPNGPKEFVKNEICGYSFKSNDHKNFRDKFIFVLKNLNSIETLKKKINAKKYSKAYTMYNHSKVFSEIFNYS